MKNSRWFWAYAFPRGYQSCAEPIFQKLASKKLTPAWEFDSEQIVIKLPKIELDRFESVLREDFSSREFGIKKGSEISLLNFTLPTKGGAK